MASNMGKRQDVVGRKHGSSNKSVRGGASGLYNVPLIFFSKLGSMYGRLNLKKKVICYQL